MVDVKINSLFYTGLTLFACHLFTAAWTGTGMNPARSFGPAVVGAKFPVHHEIYWIAPLLGGILSVIYFEILKACSYNSAVLDQDSDKEVSGLRPVHLRVYKRLAGHKDWEAATEDKAHKRRILRRRLRKAQADVDAHNEFKHGNQNYGGYNGGEDLTDTETAGTDLGSVGAQSPPMKPEATLPMPVTTPPAPAANVRAVDTLSSSTTAASNRF